MVTGFEVFGVIAGSLGVIDKLIKLVEKINEYRDAPDEIRRHQGSLLAIRRDLRNILENHTITATDGIEEYRAAFGESTLHVRVRIATITEDLRRFDRILKALSGKDIDWQDELRQPRIVKLSGFKAWFRRRGRRAAQDPGYDNSDGDDLLIEARDASSARQKAWFILKQKSKLQALLLRVQDGCRDLRTSADDGWALAHPDAGSESLNARRTRMQAAMRTLGLLTGNETREASEILFSTCVALGDNSQAADRGLKWLEMHIEPCDSVRVFTLSFPVTIDQLTGHRLRDVIIVGPLRGPTIATGTNEDYQGMDCPTKSYKDAMMDLEQLRHTRGIEFLATAPFGPTALAFQLTPSTHAEHDAGCSHIRWHEHLEAIEAIPRPYPRCYQKVTLCLRFAQAAFYLLGTSWMDYLQSSALVAQHCSKVESPPKIGRAMLEFQQLAETHRKASLDRVEPHCLLLGIVLMEIATGVPLSIILDHIDTEGHDDLWQEWNLYDEQSRERMVSPRASQEDVTDVQVLDEQRYKSAILALRGILDENGTDGHLLGQVYRDVIDFCLQRRPSLTPPEWRTDGWLNRDWTARKTAYSLDIFTDFYDKVYRPLKLLHQKIYDGMQQC